MVRSNVDRMVTMMASEERRRIRRSCSPASDAQMKLCHLVGREGRRNTIALSMGAAEFLEQ